MRLAFTALSVMLGIHAAGCKFEGDEQADTKSLTTREDDATGKKKYFFAFREVLDDEHMNNETYGDNKHITDIAKDANGGGYEVNPQYPEGFLETRDGAGQQQIAAEYDRIISQIKPGDMYMQMSAGHGYPGNGGMMAVGGGVGGDMQNGIALDGGGLAVGLTHDTVKQKAFAMLDRGAQEVMIFMMACHSGDLVDTFKNDPNLSKYKGKTLFVMASSRAKQTSSTFNADEVDANIKGGADGTAGSAFGNALWKAMRGDADEPGSGNDDGIVQLGELIDFTTKTTLEQGQHDVQFLDGYHDRNLAIKCIAEHPKSAANPLCRVGNAPPPKRAAATTTTTTGEGTTTTGAAATTTGTTTGTPSTVFDPKKPGANGGTGSVPKPAPPAPPPKPKPATPAAPAAPKPAAPKPPPPPTPPKAPEGGNAGGASTTTTTTGGSEGQETPAPEGEGELGGELPQE